MTETDIIRQTKGAYIGLLRPLQEGDEYSQAIASVIALAPSVSDDVVAAMLSGSSWRERLLGLCMAMAKPKQPAIFVDSMFEALRDPRCLSTIPTCAALALLARRGVFTMTSSFAEMFDRTPFDGEVGWAVDKAMHFVGLRSEGVPENHGDIFETHIQFYDSLRAA